MNIHRMVLILLAGMFSVSVLGCGGMKDLQGENEQLKLEVSRLQQIQNDYGDKLQEMQNLSEAEKNRFRTEMEAMRNQLNSSLQEEISQKNALVEKVNDLTVIEIGEAALFASGEADLTPRGTVVIRQLSGVLNRYQGYHVRVEGHTDAVPIGEKLRTKFKSNWELSTARATNVVRYMIYAMKMDPNRLQAVGFAQYRPAAGNDTAVGRSKNRRIRLVVFKTVEVEPAKSKIVVPPKKGK